MIRCSLHTYSSSSLAVVSRYSMAIPARSQPGLALMRMMFPPSPNSMRSRGISAAMNSCRTERNPYVSPLVIVKLLSENEARWGLGS